MGQSPGNVELSERDSHLPRRSVANVTQLVTIDRDRLEVVGRLPPAKLELILHGIDLVLGRR
ncbi:MAG: type II toxin-antitoxin system PemK/MazF family toxin [Acidimicrobiia bacterium]|nr:type II toxin-antitoxin system PemK/MazF family toxin [Acidimicrobiia bacterium]